MPPDDREVFERFSRRFAAIDHEVGRPPGLTAARRTPSAAPARVARSLALAVAVVAIALVGIPVLGGLSSLVPGPDPSPSASGTSSTMRPDASFPREVAGLEVITVERAVAMLEAGTLGGRAVAVAGYFGAFSPSCPFPGRYIGPLEGWCSFSVLSDGRDGAQLCQTSGNTTSCHGPDGIHLSPFLLTETSGDIQAAMSGGPAAAVVIGHAGDVRQWQCTASTQDACARAFVVDRVAWVDGRDVPLTARILGTPRMTLDQVTAAIGTADVLVSAAETRAGDAAAIDPRWLTAGDGQVWLVRSLGAGGRETDWLVDDATGAVSGSHSTSLDPSYRPARLWSVARAHYECCGGDTFPFMRVETPTGTIVFQGLVGGGSSTGVDGATTFGGSYGSAPLVLPGGEYAVTAWLASYAGQVMGSPHDACSTRIRLEAGGDLRVFAEFPLGSACAFEPAPSLGP